MSTPEIEAAKAALEAALGDLTHAKLGVADAHIRLDEAMRLHMKATLPPLAGLSAAAVGERIADHARDHVHGETDAHWRMMRSAIEELVKRSMTPCPQETLRYVIESTKSHCADLVRVRAEDADAEYSASEIRTFLERIDPRHSNYIIEHALKRAMPAADIAQEIAHKYEGACIRAEQEDEDPAYWRNRAEVAREIEKRLRGET